MLSTTVVLFCNFSSSKEKFLELSKSTNVSKQFDLNGVYQSEDYHFKGELSLENVGSELELNCKEKRCQISFKSFTPIYSPDGEATHSRSCINMRDKSVFYLSNDLKELYPFAIINVDSEENVVLVGLQDLDSNRVKLTKIDRNLILNQNTKELAVISCDSEAENMLWDDNNVLILNRKKK